MTYGNKSRCIAETQKTIQSLSQEISKSMPKGAYHKSFGQVRILERIPGTEHIRILTNRDERRVVHESTLKMRNNAPGIVKKSEPLRTSVSDSDAKRLVARHGLTGALPKTLDRNQRMAAYEARYVSAGGKKSEKWQHRANMADKVKAVGLGGATIGSTVWTAGRFKGARRATKAILGPLSHPKVTRGAETAVGASAAIGGAGELYGGHARRKRSSYASAPGGVAASALRRMQDYSPQR